MNIARTFVDKLMAVKRHAICGNIDKKVSHIYDVTRLFYHDDIQRFIKNTDSFKRLISITKNTDSYYLAKRSLCKEYDPTDTYGFEKWKHYLDRSIRLIYESLHENLLYTDEKQSFDVVLSVFAEIDDLLKNIGE